MHLALFGTMTIRVKPKLSKSRFLSGLQCPLKLWHQCYNPELAGEISPAQQAIFDAGHEVGRLATRLFPNGILIEEDHLHHQEAVQSTLSAMADMSISAIFEAAFFYNNVRVRVDVLERLKDGRWNLIEVKSSTKVKEEHKPDVAVQYYVLRGSGIEVNQSILMHINNQYVYDGRSIDLSGFFKTADLSDEAGYLQRNLSRQIDELNLMLEDPRPPDISPGRHCKSPYECQFWEYCTKDIPQHWTMTLTNIKQVKLDDLKSRGIIKITDIPDSYPLTNLQERIRNCVLTGSEYFAEELKTELNNVAYPVQFLDFETINPAIPRHAGTRPYQIIPFQWSNHILYEEGSLDHSEYLCEEDKDPREEFTLTILDSLGKTGSIFIYTTYEMYIIRELADFLPQYRIDLLDTLDRFIDLSVLIRKHYYNIDFHGSFSLKSVLPTLVPEMKYTDIEIQEGGVASIEYLRMIDPLTSFEEKERIKRNLLIYCGYDTLGMLKIRERLLRRILD